MKRQTTAHPTPRPLLFRARRLAGALAALALVWALGGCQSTPDSRNHWQGPTVIQAASISQAVRSEPWQYRGTPGRIITSAHYRIHTTIDDPSFLERLPQVLEGALEQYRRLAPGLPVDDKPMNCYLFNRRPEWTTFTREHTGADAATYLRINRGGYCIRDWYVAYFIGDASTYSVSAHEGWHQYVARNFKKRLPPFLEEGVATQFESIRWESDLPRWNLRYNANRVQRLRQAMDGKYLWPLEKLVAMHAGDVVGLAGEKIEAFYAQNWAFVRFAYDAENGKYRPAFQRLLLDTANGTVYDPTGGRVRLPPGAWRPQMVKPILEHYFGMPLPEIEKAYRNHLRVIAYDKFNEQWQAQ